MEKKLQTAVQDELAAALKSAWPQFEKVARVFKGEARARGRQLFRWHADEQVWFFLTLVVGDRNGFGFRFMWSDQAKYPTDDVDYPLLQNDPARIPGSHQLYTKHRGGARLVKEWVVGVNPAFVPETVVPAAVAELKQALSPLINKVLKLHGKNAVRNRL